MKKKTVIIGSVIAVILILLIVFFMPKDKNIRPPVNPTVEETLPEIEYYEDAILVDGANISTAPSKTIQMAEGLIVYTDGTEKNWLVAYHEEKDLPLEEKTFYFAEGTILTAAFNGNNTVSKIVLPDGVIQLDNCFNNNFIDCEVVLPATLESYSSTFENTQGITLSSVGNGKLTVINGVLYSDFGETLFFYPGWKQDEELILPATVKAIGEEAIFNNPYLKKVVLNEGLETINTRGIANCVSVTEVILPSTLTKIDTSFSRMFNLEKLSIPANCEVLGLNFIQAPKLTLTVDVNNPYCTLEDGVLYNKDKTLLIRYLESKQDVEYTLPNSVATIYSSAFSFNKYLEELTVNEGVTEIGTFFAECNALKTINLPQSLVSLKTMTFTQLPKLTAINYAGTIDQWLYVQKGSDWIISDLEYRLNCSDESIGYNGTA